MAAQKGLDLLLKINTTGSTYVTVGGLRSTSITMNEESVDATNKDSAGQRTLLAGGGVQSVSVSGSGVFTDSTSEVLMSSFQITSLEYAGEYNGEATYSVSLESAGAITFA